MKNIYDVKSNDLIINSKENSWNIKFRVFFFVTQTFIHTRFKLHCSKKRIQKIHPARLTFSQNICLLVVDMLNPRERNRIKSKGKADNISHHAMNFRVWRPWVDSFNELERVRFAIHSRDTLIDACWKRFPYCQCLYHQCWDNKITTKIRVLNFQNCYPNQILFHQYHKRYIWKVFQS